MLLPSSLLRREQINKLEEKQKWINIQWESKYFLFLDEIYIFDASDACLLDICGILRLPSMTSGNYRVDAYSICVPLVIFLINFLFATNYITSFWMDHSGV